jgi:redox-sensitive bicupin YhaK (pirin superfamily)
LKGEIVHKDSLGSDLAIRPGEVNLMSAGKGIVHSERTSEHHRQNGQTLFGLQTWMALPVDQEEGAPAFTNLGRTELPVVDAEGIHARLIAGSAFGVNSPLDTASPTLYADIMLSPGSQLPVPTDYVERAIYLLAGELSIDGNRFSAGQLVILKRNQGITIKATEQAQFMLFGGEPMDGPRYIWWNFVSSRLERIEAAKEEWSQGIFDTVPGDEEEFIPLPTENTRPRVAKGYE